MPEPLGDEESSAEERGAGLDRRRPGCSELIDELSTEQRQVLTLKFVFSFGTSRSAGILGKTEGAVKSLQHRALASLERQLVRP